MTNRKLAVIIKDQMPLILFESDTIQMACEEMSKRKVGCVVVINEKRQLAGIFTGRDVVRTVAKMTNLENVCLGKVMTPRPQTISSHDRAYNALQKMCDGGFRHLPVIDEGKILGVVSRNDFKGMEVDHVDQCEHLAECIW